MNLNVKERIGIQAILPYNGTLETQQVVRAIADKSNLTQEEKVLVEMRREKNGMVAYNGDRDFEKEIDYSPEELQLLKDQVKMLDEKGGINQDNLDICVKINALK